MSDFEDRLDPENRLSFENAKVEDSTALGLLDDGTVVIRYDVPYGMAEEAKKWLLANRLTVSDFECSFKKFEGTWRTLRIDIENGSGGSNAYVLHRMAKGFYTEINLVSARRIEYKKSTSVSIGAGISNSTGANPSSIITILFPFVDPKHSDSFIQSVYNYDFNSCVIQGEDIGTGWSTIMAVENAQEDTSISVSVVLSNSQFTLHAYESYGTDRQAEKYYLWNVPKNISQTIINDWIILNPTGSWITADYNKSDEFIGLILRKRSQTTNTFYSIGSISKSCRYTESNIVTYTGVSLATITSEFSSYSSSVGSGRTYELANVYKDEDGLYYGSIIERTRNYQGGTREKILDTPVGPSGGENTVYETQHLGVTGQSVTIPTATRGKIVSVNIDINEDCSKNIVVREDEAKEQTHGPFVVEDSKDKKVTKTIVLNFGGTIPAPFFDEASGTEITVVSSLNKYGLVDYEQTTTQYKLPNGGNSIQWVSWAGRGVYHPGLDAEGKLRGAIVIYNMYDGHTVKYCRTLAEANNIVTSGALPNVSGDISYVGNGIWRAHKVVRSMV